LNLGDTSLALDVCTFENRPDPEQRTLFIDEFRRWPNNLKAINDAVANSDSPALRSGICLAVGQISVGKIVDSDRVSWKDLASKWFVGKSDTSTHSASGWLLRQWKLPLPEIAKPNEIVSGRDWFVNLAGVTMLRMHPGKFQQSAKSNQEYLDREVEIKDYFWVADREVTRGQFELFAKDTSYPNDDKPKEWNGVSESASPTADHPAQKVSWYDAVMYCNWLSKREGRTPCYERSGVREKGRYDEIDYDAWRSIPGATGYRLLREVEWEYVCRAGTQTEFCMGDDEVLLKDYCQMYPCKTAAMSGQKLPNAWGLHDCHGNVYEWCEDLFDNSGSSRVKRGGGWFDGAANCRPAYRIGLVPSYRYDFMGFRLALSSSGVSRLEAEPVGGGTK
jgi:formylglycine-generating enzyme required for sulfatase activity